MLRGEFQNELVTPSRWSFPHTRNYRFIEQVFKVPLWFIETPACESTEESESLWNRYIASSPNDALAALHAHGTTKAIVHVLLPGYLVQQADPVLTRCRVLWECCVTDDQAHRVISFVTDHGEFVDYQDSVELSELEKIGPVWREQ